MPRAAGPGPERRALLRAGAAAAVTAAGLRATEADAAPASTTADAPYRGKAARTVLERSRKAPSGRWDTFNLSPARRTVRPVAVRTTGGRVERAQDLLGKEGAARTRLLGREASITLDFGKEIGGFVTLDFGEATDAGQRVALTYSELSTYISTTASDGSNGGANDEPAVHYQVPPGGRVATDTDVPVAGTGPQAAAHPAGQLRGGFRYLTVVNESAGTIALTGVSVRVTFAPQTADLRAYPNYFYCDDDLLNRVWYAGAYTVQTNIVAADQGRVWGAPELGWDNSARVGEAGGTVLVDGAKRDRTVWPGDLGISILTDHVSLGDLDAVRNSLQTLYNHQRADGALPYAGPAVNFIGESDAYHLWTLIGTADYVRFSEDTGWFRSVEGAYRKALDHITAKIDEDGLLRVTAAADWARTDADGKNIEANALMYRALVTADPLLREAGDAPAADACARRARALKAAVESAGYWDGAAGLYRDKPGSTLYPQDGNALAVWFGLVDNAERAATISGSLARRWTAVGALTPEKSENAVHPFPGSMEVHAHFAAGRDGTALDLIRREWGYMLTTPQGTASTFWEGYLRDGTPDYQGSYMSAAHGWSTGPTSALTYWLLGIAPAADGGPGYRIAPRPGGLSHAQGRLTTPSGIISVSWRSRPNGWFDLTLKSPEDLQEVGVPLPADGTAVVRRNGRRAWDHGSRFYGTRVAGGHVYLSGVPAGTHTITVRRR